MVKNQLGHLRLARKLPELLDRDALSVSIRMDQYRNRFDANRIGRGMLWAPLPKRAIALLPKDACYVASAEDT